MMRNGIKVLGDLVQTMLLTKIYSFMHQLQLVIKLVGLVIMLTEAMASSLTLNTILNLIQHMS